MGYHDPSLHGEPNPTAETTRGLVSLSIHNPTNGRLQSSATVSVEDAKGRTLYAEITSDQLAKLLSGTNLSTEVTYEERT